MGVGKMGLTIWEYSRGRSPCIRYWAKSLLPTAFGKCMRFSTQLSALVHLLSRCYAPAAWVYYKASRKLFPVTWLLISMGKCHRWKYPLNFLLAFPRPHPNNLQKGPGHTCWVSILCNKCTYVYMWWLESRGKTSSRGTLLRQWARTNSVQPVVSGKLAVLWQ